MERIPPRVLHQLTSKYSGSPHFIYDQSILIQNVQFIRNSLSRLGVQSVLFSVKSNPNPFILKLLGPFIDGFDVSSKTEMEMLTKIGVSPFQMTFSGPAKTPQALELVSHLQIHATHVDSLSEWQAIKEIEKNLNIKINKSLRVANNDVTSQKLGLSFEEFQKIASEADQYEIQGFHFYLGREKFHQEKIENSIEKSKEWHRLLAGKASPNFSLFLGIGLPTMAIVQNQSLLDLKPFDFPADWKIHAEMGRAIVQQCGSFLTEILSIKNKALPNSMTIVNGGLQQMASHLGSPRFQFQEVHLEFLRAGKSFPQDSLQNRTTICGSLSLWHDKLIENIPAPKDLERGDWVLMGPVGAYGWTAASNQFIGPPRHYEWLLNDRGELINISPSQDVSYHHAFGEVI